MQTIQARVHPEALRRVGDFFRSTLRQTLAEVLQNARRAGATRVAIEHDRGRITVTDDGEGITDPQVLLSFGESGWNPDTAHRERAAGMGMYSLARRTATVRSRAKATGRGWAVHLEKGHFTGEAEAGVYDDEGAPQPHGTEVSFRSGREQDTVRDAWTRREIEAEARYYPLEVTLNGKPVEREDFLSGCITVRDADGLRIGVARRATPGGWDINFHGKTVGDPHMPVLRAVDGARWFTRIDVVDGAGVELTLPARESVIEDDAANAMRAAARLAAYRTAAAGGGVVRLTWEDYRIGKAIGAPVEPAPAELPRWRPHTAAYRGTRPADFEPVGDGCVIVDTVLSPAAAQTLGLAAEKEVRERLRAPVAGLAGYDWYDELPRITGMRTEAVVDGTRVRLDDGNSERGAPQIDGDPPRTANALILVLEVREADGGRAEIEIPAAAAVIRDADDSTDPWDADLVVTAEAPDAETLETLVEKSLFRAVEELDADSAETQLDEFRQAAAAMVAERTGKERENAEAAVRRIVEERVLPQLRPGWHAAINVAWTPGQHVEIEVGIKAEA